MRRNLIKFVGVVSLAFIVGGCTSEKVENNNYDIKESREVLDKIQEDKYPKPKITFDENQNAIYDAMKKTFRVGSYSRLSLLGDVMKSSEAESNNFSKEDINFVMDNLDIDWEVNAYDVANEYVYNGSFSKTGLIQQLGLLKFTEEEANLAVDDIDVNWEQEAIERIYELENALTKEEIINQLVNVEKHPEEYVLKYFNK